MATLPVLTLPQSTIFCLETNKCYFIYLSTIIILIDIYFFNMPPMVTDEDFDYIIEAIKNAKK